MLEKDGYTTSVPTDLKNTYPVMNVTWDFLQRTSRILDLPFPIYQSIYLYVSWRLWLLFFTNTAPSSLTLRSCSHFQFLHQMLEICRDKMREEMSKVQAADKVNYAAISCILSLNKTHFNHRFLTDRKWHKKLTVALLQQWEILHHKHSTLEHHPASFSRGSGSKEEQCCCHFT